MADKAAKSKTKVSVETATSDQPVVQTLAIVKTENGNQVLRILSKGSSFLGYVKETSDECSYDVAYDKVKILSVRYFQNRSIFSAPVPADLETQLPQDVVHSLGIVRLPDGKYMPVSVRTENSSVRAAILFSSPLALGEAFTIYRNRCKSFFLGRKLFVE